MEITCNVIFDESTLVCRPNSSNDCNSPNQLEDVGTLLANPTRESELETQVTVIPSSAEGNSADRASPAEPQSADMVNDASVRAETSTQPNNSGGING